MMVAVPQLASALKSVRLLAEDKETFRRLVDETARHFAVKALTAKSTSSLR